MSRKELQKILTRQPFQPVRLVMSSGDSYRVDHPELAIPTADGSIYVFDLVDVPDEGTGDTERAAMLKVILSLSHVNEAEFITGSAA